MLSTTAFNAMLKTLEEPPEYLKFILATTDPQKVPATVLSRCLQFNLRPMAVETIVGHLQTILANEQVDAEPAALKLIARAARGSMRDAQSLADQAIAFGSGRIEEAAVRQMLGAVDRGQAIGCIEAVAARDGAALVAAVDRLRELGLSAAGALEEMATLLQEMAVVQAVPSAGESDDPDDADAIRLAALLPADETQLLYSIVLAGRAELPLAPDEYSGLVMVLLRMLAFAPAGADGAPVASGPTSAAQARSAAASASRSQPAVAAPVAAAARTAAAPTAAAARDEPPRPTIDRGRVVADGTAAADLWCALVARLVGAGAIAAMVRELALQAECVRVTDDGGERVWHLRVERENLRTPALRDRLQAAASEAERDPLRLEIEAAPAADTPAARDAAERARRQAAAERAIEEDPLVRALMSQYKTARIVPGSVKPLPAP
jgi:DNA polymerase-3 subunit gamma/tau